MPSARASPARTSRSPSPSQPPAVPGEPVSCERIFTTTASYLPARPVKHTPRCYTQSYAAGQLDPSLGARTGHQLFLAPDQRLLCVVGGVCQSDSATRARQVEAHVEPASEEDSDCEHDTQKKESVELAAVSRSLPTLSSPKAKPSVTPKEVKTPTHTPQKPRASPASTGRAKAAPTQSSPAAPVAETAKGGAQNAATKPTGPTSASRAEDTAGQTANGIVGANSQSQDTSPAEAHEKTPRTPLPVVPAEWRTRAPLVECLELDNWTWFTPLGEQRRAGAVVAAAEMERERAADVSLSQDGGAVVGEAGSHCSGGGGIRWPAQSVAVVLWEPRTHGAQLGTSTPSSTTPVTAPLVPTPPPDPLERRATAAASVTQRPPKAPKSSTVASAVVAGPTSAASATNNSNAAGASPPPTAKEKARDKRRQQLAAKQAQEAAALEQKRQRRLEARRRREARWSAGPHDAVLISGWERGRRLPTAVTYRLDVPAETESAPSVIHGSLPLVEMLPSPLWVPVTGHTGTVVRGKYYVFGGHSAAGSSNDLYVMENSRLRATYEIAAQRALQDDGKRLNMTFRSRNSITLGGSNYTLEMRDGLASVGQVDGMRGGGAGAADTAMPRDVAWTCTLIGGHRYETAMAEAHSTEEMTPPGPATAEASRADSSFGGGGGGSVVSASRLRGGRPASHHSVDGPPSRSAASAVAAPPVSAPSPAPRSSHAAASLANRFLIVFGGRHMPQVTATPQAAATLPGVKPRPVSRSRGKSQAKGKAPVEDEVALPTLTVLDDVVAFDVETGVWVQVRVSGANSPCARYGAALCPLPYSPGIDNGRYTPGAVLRALGSPTSESAYAQRELFLHGGIDAAGNVLNDAWVLEATGKPTSWLLERDSKTGALVLAVRWVEVRAEMSIGELLPPRPRTPSTSQEDPLPDSVTGKKKKARSGSTGKSAASDAAKALRAQLMNTNICVLPHRAHHAVVATVTRDVFIVGGDAAPTKVSVEGCEPAMLAQVEEAVNQYTQSTVYSLRVLPLEVVEEVVVDRPRAKSRPRDKA